jgi:hypothetical protein
MGDNPISLAHILAVIHSSRIYFTRLQILPEDFMDRNLFETEELMRSIKVISDDINKGPISNDIEKVVSHSKDLIMLTLMSILSSSDEKEVARQIWEPMVEYAEEAYLVYLDKFNWHLNDNDELTAKLKASLRDDFFKIPAALRTE